MIALRPVGTVLAVWAALGVAASGGSAQSPAVRFIRVLGDVPLAPNLTMVPGSAVSFDAPGGRIVQVRARGRSTRAAVWSYYRAALPNLGWRRIAIKTAARRLEFRREGEKLVLDIAARKPGVTVLFRLAPGR